MTINQIREALGAKVSESVQIGVEATMRMGGDAGSALNLGCNTALSSLLPILPFLTNATLKDKKDLIKCMNYETLLFAALIVVRMHGDLRVVNENVTDENGREGVEVAGEVNFGPSILSQALDDWKVLTKKDPAKYLNKSMLEAMAYAERESSAPFEEFLKNRINGPTSSTLN